MRLRRSTPIRLGDALEDSYDATGRWRREQTVLVNEPLLGPRDDALPDGSETPIAESEFAVASGRGSMRRGRRLRIAQFIIVLALAGGGVLTALALLAGQRPTREEPRRSVRQKTARTPGVRPRPALAGVRLPRRRVRTVVRHRRVRTRRPRVPRRAAPAPAIAHRVAPVATAQSMGRAGGEFVLGAR